MRNEKLYNYLLEVCNLEKQILYCDSAIDAIEDKKRTLGIPTKILQPEEPVRPKEVSSTNRIIYISVTVCSALVAICFIWGNAVWSFLGAVIGLVNLVLCFILVAELPKSLLRYSDENEAYEKEYGKYCADIREYQNAMNYYQICLNKDRLRVIDERKQISQCEYKIANLKADRSNCISRLRQKYEENIIYEKYRSFPYVAKLFEYIASQRFYILEGPAGAYNMLEEEIRWDTIIYQLNEIDKKFNMLIASNDSIESFVERIYQEIFRY